MDGSVDMLTLSRIANELLCIMVGSNKKPLNRESILNDLWTKRGLSSSGNNLNNYMSIIRRTLSNLGLSDLIITIPGYGFMFSAEVEVILDECNKTELFLGRSEKFSRNITHGNSLSKKVNLIFLNIRKRKLSLLTVLLLVFLIFSIFFLLVFMKGNHSFEINNCNVYLLENSRDKRKIDEDLSVIKNNVVKYKINCGRKADIFYWSDRGGGMNRDSAIREILAYCDDSRGGECVNYGLLK